MTRTPPPANFYQATAYCAEDSVGYMMKRILASIVVQADRRLEVHSLTNAQWGPLMRLQTTGGSTVAELARWLNVDAGAMTRLLDRLEKKNLCKRVRSTEDRRVVGCGRKQVPRHHQTGADDGGSHLLKNSRTH